MQPISFRFLDTLEILLYLPNFSLAKIPRDSLKRGISTLNLRDPITSAVLDPNEIQLNLSGLSRFLRRFLALSQSSRMKDITYDSCAQSLSGAILRVSKIHEYYSEFWFSRNRFLINVTAHASALIQRSVLWRRMNIVRLGLYVALRSFRFN